MKTLLQILGTGERQQSEERSSHNLTIEVVLFVALVAIAFLPMSNSVQVIGTLIQATALFLDRVKPRG